MWHDYLLVEQNIMAEIQPRTMNVLNDTVSLVFNLENIVIEELDDLTWLSPVKAQFLTGTEIFVDDENESPSTKIGRSPSEAASRAQRRLSRSTS